MDIFSSAVPVSFTKAACRDAPSFGGVYFVFRKSGLIYVGRTDHVRRRLLQHLGGKTTFAQALISRYRPPNYAEFAEENLTLVYRELDDPSFRRALEHVTIGVFQPAFNTD
jgi:excinuclease UvrABC nuclease subunit